MANYTVQMEYAVYDANTEAEARLHMRQAPDKYGPRIRVNHPPPDPEPDAEAVAVAGETAALHRRSIVFIRIYNVSATSAAEAEAKVKREPDVYFWGEYVNGRLHPA
jgi:hypothetical protein